jgi:O-antigen/teichoic acid export membrane protein
MVSNVAGPMLVYLDRILIGALVSLAAVAYYAAPYEIVARLWVLPSSLSIALFPAISQAGDAAPERLRFLYSRSIRIMLVIMVPAVFLLIAFAHPLLMLWLGPDFAAQGARVLQIVGVAVLAGSLAHIPSEVLYGLGRPDLPAKLYLVEVPIYAALAWVLTGAYGIVGTAAALALRTVVEAGVLYVATSALVPRSTRGAGGAGLTAAVALAVVMGLALAAAAVPRDLFVRMALAAVITVGFAWTAWTQVLDPRDREALRAAVAADAFRRQVSR